MIYAILFLAIIAIMFAVEDIIVLSDERAEEKRIRKEKREAVIKTASRKHVYYSNQQKLIEEYMYKDAQ